MEKEKIQEYSARVVQANRGELLVVVYDVIQDELRSALVSQVQQNQEAYKNSLQNAQKFLQELIGTLDFQYEVSFQLLSLYKYINKTILEAQRKKDTKELEGCISIIGKLRSSYAQIALESQEKPMMSNVQKVYAGLTYGKNSLSEVSVDGTGGKRGYYA